MFGREVSVEFRRRNERLFAAVVKTFEDIGVDVSHVMLLEVTAAREGLETPFAKTRVSGRVVAVREAYLASRTGRVWCRCGATCGSRV